MPAVQARPIGRARGVPEIAGEPGNLRIAEQQSHRVAALRSGDWGVAAGQIVDHVRVPGGVAQEPGREHRDEVHAAEEREGRDGHAGRPKGAVVRPALPPHAGRRRLRRGAAPGQDPGADARRDATSVRRVPHVRGHRHTRIIPRQRDRRPRVRRLRHHAALQGAATDGELQRRRAPVRVGQVVRVHLGQGR